MSDSPVITRDIEGIDVRLIGSVHTLIRAVPRVIEAIETFKPYLVCVELSDPDQDTRAYDVSTVRRTYRDMLVCIDRPLYITVSRYLSGTRPDVFFKETVKKFAYLPINMLSGFVYNYFQWLYDRLFPGGFRTLGWSAENTRRYIFERDEYMAYRLIEQLALTGNLSGSGHRYAVVAGRRHIPGISAILEAYRYTGDVGTYYAGGRTLQVFSPTSLMEPYGMGRMASEDYYLKNRIIESIVSIIFLPVLAILIFLGALLLLLIMAVIVYWIASYL